MTTVRSRARLAVVLTLAAMLLAAVAMAFAGSASADDDGPTVNCPAGGRGGNGGNGGTSTGGTGGIALNIPVFSSGTGGAFAEGGDGGSARGGTGGRGGQGVLPVCNQNTNGDWVDDGGWDWGDGTVAAPMADPGTTTFVYDDGSGDGY